MPMLLVVLVWVSIVRSISQQNIVLACCCILVPGYQTILILSTWLLCYAVVKYHHFCNAAGNYQCDHLYQFSTVKLSQTPSFTPQVSCWSFRHPSITLNHYLFQIYDYMEVSSAMGSTPPSSSILPLDIPLNIPRWLKPSSYLGIPMTSEMSI